MLGYYNQKCRQNQKYTMEQKIQKLFSFFRDIKNEPFYTSCISQIIQTFEKFPESLKFILFNLKQLIFSQTKQVRLRLKHRQICASIISKINAKYVLNVKAFINEQSPFEVQSFQLDANTGQQFKIEFSQQIWQNLDFIKIIQNQKPLYSSQRDYNEGDTLDDAQQSQKKFFEHFHEIKQATMMNMEQLLGQMNMNDKNHQNDHAERGKKYKDKINKLKTKNQHQFQEQELIISNPFNLMYQICIENILNPEWQLRHLSAMIIKQLLQNVQLLGFAQSIRIPKLESTQKRFEYLSNATRKLLINHLSKNEFKYKIFSDIAKHSMMLLCLDRFADYQSDESHIIVRIQAAEILKTCFENFTNEDQNRLFKIIKKLFDQSSDPRQTKTFTWQIKHSFVYFLNILVRKPQYLSMIFKFFQESFLKLLSTQQFDEIILCVCKCFNKFVGQNFFQDKAMDRVNEQLWNIVETLDDISISTKEALALLGKMFAAFKLNESHCLSKIEKYFTSKIPEVRRQLYSLMTLLYSRDFKADTEILDRNIIQFCQAIFIERNEVLLQQLKKLAPAIFSHALKSKRISRICYFINRILLSHDSVSNIINNLFKVAGSSNQLTQNDYTYISQDQRLAVSSEIYLDKRLMKFAKIFAYTFENKLDGLKQLAQQIENQKNSSTHSDLKDSKAIFFLQLLYSNILKINDKQSLQKGKSVVMKHYQNQIFIKMKERMVQILKMQYGDLIDPNILDLRKEFIKILEKITNNETDNALAERFKNFKTQNWKSASIIDFHKQLILVFNSKDLQDKSRQDFKVCISILQLIINNQKSLIKQMKLLASYILIKISHPEQPKQLNEVIKSIQEIVVDDRYQEISVFAAESMYCLSLAVINRKAIIYTKFNKNMIAAVAKKYNKSTTGLKDKEQQQENNFQFQGNFMAAISLYVNKIGRKVPKWIQEFSQCFLDQIQKVQKQNKNQKLYLLNGTISSLLSINSEEFMKLLLEKLTKLLNYFKQPQSKDKINYPLVCQTIQSCFLYCCPRSNYTKACNVFFQWYLKHLCQFNVILYEILEKVGKSNLSTIAPVSSLFVMQIVRSISEKHTKTLSMSCLSNLIVGVYTNIEQLPFSQSLQKVSEESTQFVRNFKDANKFEYKIRIKHKQDIQLRNYQMEGISWLGFLTKYNLNGALCDDMGLGKTLQVLTVIENQYEHLKNDGKPLPNSLIVVPTTIMEHWVFQHRKYFQNPNCKAIVVSNGPHLDKISQSNASGYIIITNYNYLERKILAFSAQSYKFIILDQGHIIKNVKTKKFKAVKQLDGQHRFILTGTPIQNKLKQLWGLFDFLMPDYLSTEQNFKKTYEKLFQVNLTTFKEDQLMFSQAQRKTLQKLHFKVMPFIMRRLKNDVLSELPNKIINDYYCQMTKVQLQLYQQFQKRSFHGKNQKSDFQQGNVLSCLVQMRKILNHPALVGKKQEFSDSGKFNSLQDLFDQLGFNQPESAIQNKVILFSRFNQTIDLIEKLFMKEAFPKIKYLKLTGTTKVANRFTIAQTFNGDSQYKVLLVTTAVGGEGLNLCSANVVIMFDHDYNPTVDMQAIDRAHRIGQNRVVNVYRLITKDTLQERIMGIQKFKTNLANAIVNIDNASIKNVKDSKLPDLLQNIDTLTEDKEKQKKVSQSMYQKMIEEIKNNAIEQQDYQKKY